MWYMFRGQVNNEIGRRSNLGYNLTLIMKEPKMAEAKGLSKPVKLKEDLAALNSIKNRTMQAKREKLGAALLRETK